MALKIGRGADQFPLRLPPGMRDQIKRAAEESGRSMNSEILDVLREVFPQEPSLEELVDEIGHTITLLRDILESSHSPATARNSKVLSVLGRLTSVNEDIWKAITAERRPLIVKLDQEVMDGVSSLKLEWELNPSAPELNDSVVNGLIQMSLDRIARGEEDLKIWIGEGEARRMLRLERPAAEPKE